MFPPTISRVELGELRFQMTYEEYLTAFEDTVQAEWVEGEVTVFVPQTFREAGIKGFLIAVLRMFLCATELGGVLAAPFEMRLWPGRSSRMPDVLVWLHEHDDRLTHERFDGPADIVFEIVSDDSVERDYVEKRREYAEAGIPEYWIVDGRYEHRAVLGLALCPDGAYEAIPVDANGRVRSRGLYEFWLEPDWFTRDELPSEVATLRCMLPWLFTGEVGR